MAEYFTQLLPLLDRGNGGGDESLDSKVEFRDPRIELFLIYNPSLVSANSESFDELSKQIVCCISPNGSTKWTLESQTNIVGLIQGLESLSLSISKTSQQNSWSFNSLDSRVIVQKVENEYYFACCVASPDSYKNTTKMEATALRIASNIAQAYGYFTLLNSTMSNLAREYNNEVLELTLREFWSNYVESYNANGCEALNRKGLLGLLPSTKPVFKRSTASLGPAAPEIVRLLGESVCLKDVEPSAVLVSCFDRSLPKRYGSLYMDTVKPSSVSRESLVRLYNYLEYLDYSERMSEASKITNKTVFSTVETTHEEAEASTEAAGLTLAALDLLNPIHLANNLVVLPVNYTVSGMKNTFNQERWLPRWMGGALSQVESTLSEENEEDEADHNVYLTGPNSSLIFFLDTPDGFQQFRLVTYQSNKSGVNITLVFDATFSELDKDSFYQQLSSEVLEVAMEDIEGIITGTNALGNSLSSLPQSLNGISPASQKAQSVDVDSNFFFVTYDMENGSFKSSLPYLPSISPNSIGTKFKIVMHHLHNQLIDILVAKRDGEFFTQASTEYFHKFSANKHNDWMLYYLKYQEKYIIIIKNHSKLAKKKKQQNIPDIPPSLLAQITNGVYDYAPLGFLDNLGDDIKVWLEKLTTSDVA